MMNEQTIILLSSLGMAVVADKSYFCVFAIVVPSLWWYCKA